MGRDFQRRPKKNDGPSFKVNEQLHFDGKVRIISDGQPPLITTMSEARSIAEKEELDLVLVTDTADMPIIRLCDYDKFLFDLKKNKKKAKVKPLKEIELSANISDHDLETKSKAARKFIESGHKVKVTLKLKGREMVRREDNKKSIYKFVVSLEDVAVPESTPKDEGKSTVVILKKKG